MRPPVLHFVAKGAESCGFLHPGPWYDAIPAKPDSQRRNRPQSGRRGGQILVIKPLPLIRFPFLHTRKSG